MSRRRWQQIDHLSNRTQKIFYLRVGDRAADRYFYQLTAGAIIGAAGSYTVREDLQSAIRRLGDEKLRPPFVGWWRQNGRVTVV